MLAGLTFGDASALERERQEEETARREAKARRRQQKKQKSKKHKKDKSHKKDKRSKEERRSSGSGGSSGGSSGSEDEWQRQQRDGSPGSPRAAGGDGDGGDEPARPQREDWMTVPMARSELFKQPQAKEPEKPADPEEAPIISGIRYMKPGQAEAAAAAAAARQTAAAAGAAKSTGLGLSDATAGVSWRVRALQRAQKLASEQGRGLNEVLSERWGSAAEIAKGLMDNAAAAAEGGGEQQQQQQRGRGPGGGGGERRSGERSGGRDGPTPHYLAGMRSEQGSMKRPSAIGGGNKLSWRRPGDGGGGGAGAGERDRAGRREEGGAEDRGRRDGDRRRPEDGRHRERSRDRDGGDRDGAPHGGGERGGKGRAEQDRRQDRSSREERGGDGERARDRDRGGGREQRGRADDQGRDSRGGGGGSWQQRHEQEKQRREQSQVVEALKAVAGSINTFSNDGSFFEQAARHQEEPRQEQEQEQEEKGGQREHQRRERDERRRQEQEEPRPEPVRGQQRQADSSRGFQQQQEQEQEQQQQEQQQRREGGPNRPPAAADVPVSAPKLLSASGVPAPASNRSTADLLRARLAGKPAAAAATPGGNRSAADALRARLGGKPPPAAPADADGAGADGGGEDGDGDGQRRSQREVVVLPLVDAAGRAAPGAFGREGAGEAQRAHEAAAGGRVPKRVQRYGADGSRERYFADDDSVDLQTLVKRAKHGDDSMDIDRALACNIAARQRFKEADLDADAEYDHDAGLELSESRRRRGTAEQQRARERQRQVSQFNRAQRLEDRCTFCFSSAARPRDLAIAVGQATYLSLVQRGRLADGHCCIVPAEHVASTRQVDDPVWTEVRNFQKCLIRMFMAQGKEVLFLETAMGLGTHRHHAVMEAIPVPPDAFAKAPMYFKKAMQESESEWAQHAGKAVIDTKAKGLRGSVPVGFPYLYVQFGYGAGFLHVIDDEARFDRQLGRQVVAGLLRLPPEAVHRQRADAPAVQASMAAEFRKAFAPYDWTKALD